MAVQEVKLNKQVFGKISYSNIVDTEFTQLVTPQDVTEIPDPMTVPEFFQEYDRLFIEIPRKGNFGSHEELVKRSSSYIGVTGESDEMQALLDEINDLRVQLLSSQQEIINLSSNT
tara:strand:- start:7083 stop:7430 length:348 start_codon:yes stop_codon:yes gene_type:complete